MGIGQLSEFVQVLHRYQLAVGQCQCTTVAQFKQGVSIDLIEALLIDAVETVQLYVALGLRTHPWVPWCDESCSVQCGHALPGLVFLGQQPLQPCDDGGHLGRHSPLCVEERVPPGACLVPGVFNAQQVLSSVGCTQCEGGIAPALRPIATQPTAISGNKQVLAWLGGSARLAPYSGRHLVE